MAHRRQSIKKIRIDKRRREVNVRIISELKTVARKLQASLTAKKHDDAVKNARAFYSYLDKAVKKGIIHKNRASRRKSRIARRVNLLKAGSK